MEGAGGGDWPDGFYDAAAVGVDLAVEEDGAVAVVGDEADAFADLDFAPFVDFEVGVFGAEAAAFHAAGRGYGGEAGVAAGGFPAGVGGD